MSEEPTTQSRPLVPLLILHAVAAVANFVFFTALPIGACILVMLVSNDPGGPLFFPIFIISVLVFAAITTTFLASTALLSDLLLRRYYIPLWLPPLVVFGIATGVIWGIAGEFHPAVPPVLGIIITLAFVIHWAAISTVWFLPRFFFRVFGVHYDQLVSRK